MVNPVKDWSKEQADNTITGLTTLINSEKRKEAFQIINTYGTETDKIVARVSAGTAAVAGTVALGATAVYAAPYAAAAATAVSVKAYTAVSATALGNYLWHNPDVGLDAYGLGSDVYHGNWGNLPTDILAFAYNGANYQSYKTARTQSYTYSAEPTDVQKNYKAVIADAGSSMGVGEVNVNKVFTDEPVSWSATRGTIESGADNIATGPKLNAQLAYEEANSIFTKSGTLQPEVIKNSSIIIPGNELKNPDVINNLIKNGGNINDWGKMTTQTFKSPSGDFQFHFYQNLKTGEVSTFEMKAKFNK